MAGVQIGNKEDNNWYFFIPYITKRDQFNSIDHNVIPIFSTFKPTF